MGYGYDVGELLRYIDTLEKERDTMRERVRVLEELLANVVDYSKWGADNYKKRVRYEEMVNALTGGKGVGEC